MFVDGDPEKGVFLFAHGAGAPADSEFMSLMADALVARGVQVVRFEFSYMAQRRHGGSKRPPDRINKLEVELLELVERFDHDLPVFIGGKSMGGRVAVRVLEASRAKACFVFGYPLHPAGNTENVRLEGLTRGDKPIHLFQGERDKLGSKEDFAALKLSENVVTTWFDDADHDLAPRKRSGATQAQYIDQIAERVCAVIEQLR